MHYKYKSIIIKSENSAKPLSTPSRDMLSILNDFIMSTDTVLDYGCGKLRYTIPLSKIATRVIGVDSKEQLTRSIRISGELITLVEYAKRFKNVILCTINSEDWKATKYNKIVLSHVLSSIPFDEERIKVVLALKDVMDENSILLACTNHRMSYFKKWEKSSKVLKYNDGFLVKEPIPSYFGVINKTKLSEYFASNGYEILKSFIKEDNSYCICKLNV